MSFLKNIKKMTGNEYAGIASDGIETSDVSSFIDTGSYVLNALMSGSIYGGLPSNKITALAGESSTGKTFFTMGIMQSFLSNNEKAEVVFFDTESAVTSQMLTSRGIDASRVGIVPVATIQEFNTQCTKVLDGYAEIDEAERPPLMICLDSLGMLSTSKEMNDMSDGKEVVDMTKAKLAKGTFRVLTLKLSKVKVPMIVTNHTYDQVGSMFPQKVMSGGSGLFYASTNILFLSKKKEKVGTEVVGNIVHCLNKKSRLTMENKMVDVLLTYKDGLSKYYGLPELAEQTGVFKKVSTRFELPDGTKVFGKTLLDDPEKYFTKEILDEIDKRAGDIFLYGRGTEDVIPVEEKENE